MTKEELQGYKDLNREIELLEEEAVNLRTRLESPAQQAMTGTPKGTSSHDKIGDMVAKLGELYDLINGKWDELIGRRIAIEKAIEALEPGDRLLIRYRYITGYKWDKIAETMGYSWKQIHRIHNSILEKMKDDTQ